ncbi:bifunctional diguanylate cyclase/phosphodiesterase [Paenibacillus antri]|uniref:Bifunctional diguanylate cyclase/phosphodiesterase n=1 Tax=Paenibacillus antri TaxID=2582848 RepID=A0A5R9G1Q8_9BACL|nr:bifunctional diguanylate cyclase/phosphodiesterase [Paenibacillus antri]TLS49741.1 bifunctional diguanylate cyclase/phosphodiesterase [Paenibacillus antri]
MSWYRNRTRWMAVFAGYIAVLHIGATLELATPLVWLSLQCVIPAFAWLLLRHVARRSEGSYRTFWHLISTGCLFYFLALLVWSYYEGFARIDPPVPSLADALWNAQTVLFIAAICYLMAKERSVYQGVKVAIDAFIILIVVAAVMWEYFMEPNLGMMLSERDWAAISSVAVYPVSDLVIVFCLLFIGYAYRGLFAPRVQGFLTAGLLLFVCGDVFFMAGFAGGADTDGWADVSYAAAMFALASAGMYALGGRPGGVSERHRSGWGENLRYLLPYGVAAVLLVLPITQPGEERIESLVANGVIVSLIMLRQAFVMMENRALLRGTSRLLRETDYLANHDTLTGLPNRMHFEKALAEALETAPSSRIAVLFFDLDRFKYINDSYGHDVGDALLRQVADRMKVEAEGKHIVSRRGGDEFTVLLQGMRSDAEIGEWTERFLRCLAKPIEWSTHELLTGASAGIAVYPQDARLPAGLLKKADAAMYKAKAHGGGRYCFFTEELDRSFARTAALEHSLRRALDRGEFVLHYQPMYETVSGRMIGAEALLRWQRKNGALVSPAEFIPLAEETGLIVGIGEWAIREACRFAKLWLDACSEPFEISVNVSPVQFRQPDFAKRTMDVLRETGVPPEALVLEITESLTRDDEAIRKLEFFKRQGIHISLDDFGTGYSSLSDLHHLPVDALKIAQNFTKDMLSNEKQCRIVKAIVALAKSLDLVIVAEGVETEEQFLFMHRLGCDIIQGYYFSKPMPEEELLAKSGRSAS